MFYLSILGVKLLLCLNYNLKSIPSKVRPRYALQGWLKCYPSKEVVHFSYPVFLVVGMHAFAPFLFKELGF